VRPEDVSDDVLILDDFERRHIIATLRKELNDTIRVTDGQGTLYTGIIKEIGKRLLVEIKDKEIKPRRSVSVTLACGFIKQNRLDFILEKGTELGVERFLFFRSRYANYFTPNLRRFQKVMRQALKQSLQFFLPRVDVYSRLDDFLHNVNRDAEPFIAVDAHYPKLPELLREKSRFPGNSLIVAVGPEGGFTLDELRQFTDFGFKGFSLGPQRLRTETAAIASLAIVNQYIH